jgi:hypothetical protein
LFRQEHCFGWNWRGNHCALDGIVLTDKMMQTPAAVVVRRSKHHFQIYSTKHNYDGHTCVHLLDQDFLSMRLFEKKSTTIWTSQWFRRHSMTSKKIRYILFSKLATTS